MGPCICKACVWSRGEKLTYSPKQPSITISAKPEIIRVTLVANGGVHTKELTISQSERVIRLLQAANKAALSGEWQVLGSVDY